MSYGMGKVKWNWNGGALKKNKKEKEKKMCDVKKKKILKSRVSYGNWKVKNE